MSKPPNLRLIKTPACPLCSKPRVEAYRPFCSKRCADVDMGRWLKEGYSIPGDETVETGDEASDAERDVWPKPLK